MTDLNKLAKISGESGFKTRNNIKFPFIKFNGSKNEFSLLTKTDNGTESTSLTPPLKIVILKVRRIYSAFERTPDGTSVRWYTNEHDKWSDPLVLFKRVKGQGKPSIEFRGDLHELKDQYPKLRLNLILYVLYNDEIHKISVKGKSLSGLFDYFGSLEPSEHIFEHYINLGSHVETNSGGLTYYVLDFDYGEQADMDKVSKLMEKLDQIIVPAEGPSNAPTAETKSDEGVSLTQIPF